MAKKLAVVLGIVFVVVGALGYVSNPVVGDGAYFHSDSLHNIVHLVSGAILLLAGLAGAASTSLWLKVVGIVYLLVAILGYFAIDATGTGTVLGFLTVNAADNVLHVVLAVVILIAAFAPKGAPSAAPMAPQM